MCGRGFWFYRCFLGGFIGGLVYFGSLFLFVFSSVGWYDSGTRVQVPWTAGIGLAWWWFVLVVIMEAHSVT